MLKRHWLPLALYALAVILYGWQSWHAAHAQLAVIDESAYLSKGYLFFTGAYRPFEAGGPWMNKPPLVFQIFGLVQGLFGPGLRSGRMFAFALGLLSLLGLGAAARRLAGPWAAVPALWLIALNPALIKVYSLAASEVLVACLLSWTLFFALGRERSLLEQMLAAALAAILVLVRINLAPVPLLLLAYLAWRHGLRRAWPSAFVFLVVMFIGYAPYWPEVLQLWAVWFPSVRWLDPYRIPQTGQVDPFAAVWPLRIRLDSLAQTVRIHLALLSGVLLGVGVVRRELPLRCERLFLLALFLTLFLAHAFASLGLNYCVYCLNAYMGFFYPAGALLIALSLPQPGGGRLQTALALTWALALLLSPTPLLAGLRLPADSPCRADLLADYERAAADLARVIPPGSTVYWMESDAIAVLLQVPGASTYPPLLNDGFSYRLGGDTSTLLRYGLWNDRLAAIWLDVSDFVVSEEPLRTWRTEILRVGPIPSCGDQVWFVYR